MNKNNSFLLLFSTLLMFVANSVQAGRISERQDMGFLYGIGGSLAMVSNKKNEIDGDPTFGGSIILGLEDKNWAIEGTLTKTTDANLTSSEIYSIEGGDIGLAYRSGKRANFYYKLKASKIEMDINNTNAIKASGTAFTVGLGYLLKRKGRLELDYSYFRVAEGDFTTLHMFSLRYIWGGSTVGLN